MRATPQRNRGPRKDSFPFRFWPPRDTALQILCSAALCAGSVFTALQPSRAAAPDQPKQDPNGFVREVLQHECDQQLQDQALWNYRETKVENGRTQLYTVYQTKQGEIARLTSIDGQPVSPGQAEAEDARIAKMINHSNEMRSEQRKKAEDGEHARNLLKLFPDAFLYQYDGNQGAAVRLKFTPNAKFHAEGHAAQVFHHMEGTILLDAAHQRLISISGKLITEVKFGGGLFGHLDPGGTFDVKQEEVSPGFWEVTTMRVEMHGKALFFKTIGAHDDESYSDFKRVPDNTSLQQAAAFVRRNANGN